jgi:hypothetical protein
MPKWTCGMCLGASSPWAFLSPHVNPGRVCCRYTDAHPAQPPEAECKYSLARWVERAARLAGELDAQLMLIRERVEQEDTPHA